ncbi:MAG: AbrB/MazE/SpoVT family DNA-binding domain-containing protein [Candidatus Njordarchaeales archaeon]
MAEITTLDDRGRVLIGKNLRRKYGLKEKSIVVLIPLREGILIKPIKDPLKRLSEILRGITWDRRVRKRVEEWVLRQVGEKES